jgi:hypothetical protein
VSCRPEPSAVGEFHGMLTDSSTALRATTNSAPAAAPEAQAPGRCATTMKAYPPRSPKQGQHMLLVAAELGSPKIVDNHVPNFFLEIAHGHIGARISQFEILRALDRQLLAVIIGPRLAVGWQD